MLTGLQTHNLPAVKPPFQILLTFDPQSITENVSLSVSPARFGPSAGSGSRSDPMQGSRVAAGRWVGGSVSPGEL